MNDNPRVVTAGEAEHNEWCTRCSGPIDAGEWCGQDDHGLYVCERCMK